MTDEAVPKPPLLADAKSALIDALQQRLDAGEPVRFWLRDDDAVAPEAPLERLLGMTGTNAVPITLAVIPAFSGEALAAQLRPLSGISVAVHGWSHENHAPAEEKKQELGAHRPLEEILAQLQRGFEHLQQLHGAQFVPLLVPPWNRISAELVPALSGIGFKALSSFAEASFEALPVINTQVDIIDWKGNRGGRDTAVLFSEITAQLQAGQTTIGFLSHHLVHDQQAWRFLEQLFELGCAHPAVEWVAVDRLL